ncbi:hypothetical protein [Wenzhouxiangella sp. AB-CW3]|uniref:hypothetical protein n=1 Tax=Wenzhouxiangella sp. AB-CW3 TaxID=2771012 RepID=UPI001CC2ADD8|nr:hypothetical protein [Wenzhouxiangella sp. AB-CW3]
MLVFSIVLFAPVSAEVDDLVAERIDLFQRQSVIIDHERLVGNVRAQARREGVIVRVPQLFIYLYDHSGSWHLDGFRRGFERELNLTVKRERRARTMVRLDRLLGNVTDPAGDDIEIADLPAGDVFILLYRRQGCDECERVEQAVGQWLSEATDLSPVWIDVWMDRRPEG